MGFLDQAKAAATSLAAKADSALNSTASTMSGSTGGGGPAPDALLHDLGVLTYLEVTGRDAPAAERERVLAALQDAEQRGALRSFALRSATPVAPPPPGAAAAGAVPPPPGAAAAGAGAPPPPAPGTPPPPAPGGFAPPPPAPMAAPAAEPVAEPAAPPAAPPPPPSWA